MILVSYLGEMQTGVL